MPGIVTEECKKCSYGQAAVTGHKFMRRGWEQIAGKPPGIEFKEIVEMYRSTKGGPGLVQSAMRRCCSPRSLGEVKCRVLGSFWLDGEFIISVFSFPSKRAWGWQTGQRQGNPCAHLLSKRPCSNREARSRGTANYSHLRIIGGRFIVF